MKVEEIWRSWKAVQRMKNYIIFFSVKRQPFYRAYETDAEVLSYLFWFKIWQQWDTKYVWFPKDSGKKYFSALKDAGYSFVVVHDVEWDGNRKAIAKNDWTKNLKRMRENKFFSKKSLRICQKTPEILLKSPQKKPFCQKQNQKRKKYFGTCA